jgi:hypothetical protein
MRECEHTCSGCPKIQARAMDPSKYLAEIRMGGTGRWAGPWGTSPGDPCLRESSRAVCGLPVSRPAVRSKALCSMYRRSRLCPRPPPERANICTYVPNLSKQEGYIQGTGVLHVQETCTTQRYLSKQQCTSSNSEKGGEKREGLSPAYVSANGSRLQTPARTSLYWVIWRYGKLYDIYGNSAGCKPLTCNLDCWLIYNNNQVLLVVSK